MTVEEWPQVVRTKNMNYQHHNKDFGYEQKAHSTERRVMPYAYNREAKKREES